MEGHISFSSGTRWLFCPVFIFFVYEICLSSCQKRTYLFTLRIRRKAGERLMFVLWHCKS